jgi:hypothetical protein
MSSAQGPARTRVQDDACAENLVRPGACDPAAVSAATGHSRPACCTALLRDVLGLFRLLRVQPETVRWHGVTRTSGCGGPGLMRCPVFVSALGFTDAMELDVE